LEWIEFYYDDVLNGVIQDSNGKIVVCGIGYNNSNNNGTNGYLSLAAAPPLKVNPMVGGPVETFTSSTCGGRGTMFVMKLDLEDGSIDWNHYYSPEDDVTATRYRSWGLDLVETKRNNVIGYRIVGYGRTANGWDRPFIVQVNEDGMLTWKKLVEEQLIDPDLPGQYIWRSNTPPEPGAPAIVAQQPIYTAIDRVFDGPTGQELFVLSGNRATTPPSAFAQYFVETATTSVYAEPVWTKDVALDLSSFTGLTTNAGMLTSCITFHVKDGVRSVVWPVIGNLIGVNVGEGFVYKLDPIADGAVIGARAVGELHAYDLRLGVTSMTNGNVAICTTKWPVGYSYNGLKYGWDSFSSNVQECLESYTLPVVLGGWNGPSGTGPAGVYNFYGSQSYVAELSGTDLSLVWEKQWQQALLPSDDCYPGNARRRQCNFQLVEAPDGGLVVCGNTGHNFDDALLVKLKLCETFFSYANLPLDVNGEHHISTATVWNTERYVRGKIVIDPGGTLTVDGATIHFADGRQTGVPTSIAVKRGGTLNVINGATLTNIEACGGSMWDGISVIGTTGGGVQGEVYINTGSKVSNALTAVLAGIGDPANPGFNGPHIGGKVDIRDAVMENNLFDVVLHGIPNGTFFVDQWIVPFFQNVQFKTTAHLNYPALDPIAHVRVADHGLVRFYGCTFANELPTHYQSHRMGHGIETLNANVAVWPTGGQASTSVFRNLDHGVHSVASYGSPYTNVIQSTFVDNICGVYMADVPGATVKGNTITMGRWDGVGLSNSDETHWFEYHRGIFTTGTTAFAIQDNVLGRSASAPIDAQTEGIVVGYTEDNNEIVYRNSASGLERAFVGEGVCAQAGAEDQVGLQFQCNSNSDNGTNIFSRYVSNAPLLLQPTHGIRSRQGSAALSAGNTFDRLAGNLDIAVNTINPATPEISYYYSTATLAQQPLYYTQTGDNIVEPLAADGTAQNACTNPGPGVIGGGGTITSVKPIVIANRTTYGNTRYLYNGLIDGGNTDEVVQEVTSAWPNEMWELRAYLLSKSPYLSVDALKSMVDKDGIPVAIKGEVCIANPDATKKEGFLKWAEYDATLPLPAYMIDNIRASWDVRTYRTTLEMRMADQHTALTQAANHLLHLYQTGTVPATLADLQWVWQQVRTTGARYAEAALLLGAGHHTEAKSMVLAMPVEKELRPGEEEERQRMLTYIEVLLVAKQNSRNAYQLNGTEVAALETMAADHYDRPSNYANNLLCAAYGKCRPPLTGGSARPKAARPRPTPRPAEAAASLFTLYPNPANAYVQLNYNCGTATTTHGLIVVREISGRTVATLPMAGNVGQQVLDTRTLAAGSYLVAFTNGATTLHTEKLIVQP